VLLADGCPNSVEDLRVYESAILDVASTEMIDLKTKLTLANEEVSEEVLDFLLDQGRASDPQVLVRRQIGVSDVVITRQLKRWHALHAVMLIYRDALHDQLNARYGEQYRDYRKLARDARSQTVRFGVGVAANPVPQAAPAAIDIASDVSVGGTYFVRVAWLDGLGREGTPSVITALDVAAGSIPVIGAVNPPAGVVGFNVYVGLSEDSLGLQNPAPVGVGTTFAVAGGVVVAGAAPGDGQKPDTFVTAARILRRG
jgi:hypothetical protein